jgi:hypothetical protein
VTAALWLIAVLAAPVAARRLRPALPESLATQATAWAKAAYGLLPLYGAWVTGAIVARDAGLRGVDRPRWIFGLAVCVFLLLVLLLLARRPAAVEAARRWFAGERGWWPLLEEPRWGFYRAVAAVLIPLSAVSQLLGLGFGVVEWLLRRGPPSDATPAAAWAALARLGVSAGLYALTGNLWLVLAAMAAARAILLHQWR